MRGRNHKEGCNCPICTNTKYPQMGFQKGKTHSQSHRDKLSTIYKKLHKDGKINMKEKMNQPEMKDKISKSNKIRMKKIIHHINGDHSDNRPENLKEMSQSEHFKLHWKQGDIDGEKR